MNDLIGKDGIEKTQESQLRGINGEKSELIQIMDGGLNIEPVPGNDVVLTIDLQLQEQQWNLYNLISERIRGQADKN